MRFNGAISMQEPNEMENANLEQVFFYGFSFTRTKFKIGLTSAKRHDQNAEFIYHLFILLLVLHLLLYY